MRFRQKGKKKSKHPEMSTFSRGKKNPLCLFGPFDLEMSGHFTSNFFGSCSCCRGISRGISASFSLGSQEMGAKEKGAAVLTTFPVVDDPKEDAWWDLYAVVSTNLVADILWEHLLNSEWSSSENHSLDSWKGVLEGRFVLCCFPSSPSLDG